jgi:HK97 gp10 family phage protein
MFGWLTSWTKPTMQVDWRGDEFALEVQRYAGKRLESVLDTMVDEIRYNISRNQRSLPGEYPGRDTGRLQESVYYTISTQGGRTIGHVGATAPYAMFLEKGTRNMEARPFLSQTFEAMRPYIGTLFAAKKM